jgi:hypothetical protein
MKKKHLTILRAIIGVATFLVSVAFSFAIWLIIATCMQEKHSGGPSEMVSRLAYYVTILGLVATGVQTVLWVLQRRKTRHLVITHVLVALYVIGIAALVFRVL